MRNTINNDDIFKSVSGPDPDAPEEGETGEGGSGGDSGGVKDPPP